MSSTLAHNAARGVVLSESSRADRAHGTETGYAGRRTSREDSVSVHRDGVINSISAKP